MTTSCLVAPEPIRAEGCPDGGLSKPCASRTRSQTGEKREEVPSSAAGDTESDAMASPKRRDDEGAVSHGVVLRRGTEGTSRDNGAQDSCLVANCEP
ncbi:hypothetical protein FOMPIDRAFT_118185 [Fomitopsis schrenkii]|uniref:Uncharacterized protein n=1 Tax=Fomitopsis schrenkii TaxID=2126942 RepID=S8F3D4_FOMSC|nr:hypothetical protein FOMPIDRAFT_118185 [Fomitopsis schrenkii]